MSDLARLQEEVRRRDGKVPAMLPAAAYTSEEVLAWERRHVFAGGWTCLGRVDELLTDTQRAVMVGDVAALLTRDGSTVRMFANTCRHRAHELLPEGESSARRSVICPYHAWSYDLAGDLVAAPGYRGEPGFEPAAYSLVELPVAVWQGWVFGHALRPLGDPDVVPFETWLGDLAGIVAPYDPGSLVLADRHSYEIAANWKIVAENYHECYHCPLIHPELCQVTPPTSGDNYDLPGAWVGGSMVLRDGMATMSLTGESGGLPIPGVPPTAVEYVHLLPNLLVSAHPDYVMTHRLVPLAPGRTWIECSWYLVPRPDGTVPDATYAVEFWDLTNRQDWAACESVQRGLGSPHFAPGPFSPNEDAVERFVALVSRAYVGASVHDYRHRDPVG
ncbi:aromatic ring-hydroxylating oxygenase subunit alpha [Nocardioides mangrovi]|uniref:Rieske 2Fe-2S domain-containing protein n=1 Tax=Nocardioides mangrovi TaxID=2874580 RepID=A0ABS7UCT8_9ACTN|nr:SRPBCC family protein [Nocardioides mangrovi]MBZ5738697.1 Rieske 2Fe-2S domain-containing protein [Nocardioides mangrovi]